LYAGSDASSDAGSDASSDVINKRVAVTGGAIGECVKSTNSFRSKHQSTGGLQWDAYLAQKAQAYAEKLLAMSYQNGRAQLIHDKATKGKMGENLYWSDNSKPGVCDDANKAWYSEIKDYSFAKAGSKNGYAVGHFTQLVWKDTTKFGLGIATGKSIKYAKWGNVQTFIVAKYQKPGNFYWMGKKYESYTKQVQPLKG